MQSIKELVAGIPLSTDYLSVRLYNCLRRAGYFYLSDVIDFDRLELMSVKNIGQGSVNEFFDLRDKLSKFTRKEVIAYCCKIGNYSEGENSVILDLESHSVISVANHTVVDPDSFTCISNSGVKMEDCPLLSSDLSTRSYNALRRAKIDTVRELALYNSNDLLKVKNFGRSSYEEVISFIKARTELAEKNKVEIIPDEAYDAAIKICAYFDSCFNNEMSDVTRNILLTRLSAYYCSNSNMKIDSITVLKDLLYDDPIKQMAKEKLFQIVGKTYFDCITINECKAALSQIDIVDDKAIQYYIDEMINQKQIVVRNGYLFNSMPTFEEWISTLSDNNRNILLERCSGKTLEEVGSRVGVTRERIRQIVVKILKKRPILLEDGFADIYTKYAFTNSEYQKLFDVNPYIIGFLNLAYSKGKNGLDAFLADQTIPGICKSRVAAAFNDRFLVTESNEIIELNREKMLKWFLKKYFSDKDATLAELESAYIEWLKSYGLDNNTKLLYASGHSFEANVGQNDFCLLKLGKRVRYYDVGSVDVSELLNKVNITQYQGFEISTYKIFADFPEVMQQYDIRDEYELHNIFRKNTKVINEFGISIGRMPMIVVGNGKREKQVKNLLFQLAPISCNDLALEYEIRYGVKKETVLANFFQNIMIYYDGNRFDIDQPRLSLSDFNTMKSLLTEDFYFWSDLARLFSNVNGEDKIELLNSVNIQELGFRMYSQYVIRNTFITADAYFGYLLKRAPLFSLDDFVPGMRSVQAFRNALNDLRDSLDVIEISKDKFVSYSYFNSSIANCDKDTLKIIGQRLVELKEGELYSISADMVSDQINPIIDRINTIYFYNSLIRVQEGFKSAIIGDACVVSNGNKEPNTRDVFMKILKDNGSMSFDDLIEFSIEEYRIQVNRQKIINLLNNTDGISLDLHTKTICVEEDSSENVNWWNNSEYEVTINNKMRVILSSIDRIETYYKQERYSPFVKYCKENNITYVKELLDVDFEAILNMLELSEPVVSEAINQFFCWVNDLDNQSTEAQEILDMFFK